MCRLVTYLRESMKWVKTALIFLLIMILKLADFRKNFMFNGAALSCGPKINMFTSDQIKVKKVVGKITGISQQRIMWPLKKPIPR